MQAMKGHEGHEGDHCDQEASKRHEGDQEGHGQESPYT